MYVRSTTQEYRGVATGKLMGGMRGHPRFQLQDRPCMFMELKRAVCPGQEIQGRTVKALQIFRTWGVGAGNAGTIQVSAIRRVVAVGD